MKKTAVIFDMDGLLVDTEIISCRIYQILLQPYGYDFTKHEYATHYSGKTEIKNVMRLIEDYHLPWSVEQGLSMVKTTEETLLQQGVDLKCGVYELLDYLKNHHYQLAVASSSTRKRAEMILNAHHILNDFTITIFAEDITASKPDPQIFLKAASGLMVQPQDAVVFEDSENGIRAAHNANIDVICIPDMKIPSNDLLNQCVGVYPTLKDAIAYFEQ